MYTLYVSRVFGEIPGTRTGAVHVPCMSPGSPHQGRMESEILTTPRSWSGVSRLWGSQTLSQFLV